MVFFPLYPSNERELQSAVKEYKKNCLADLNQSLETKLNKIDSYLKQWDIKSVVVGASGGIDSTLVIAILDEINKRRGSKEFINIHAVTITFNQYEDVFEKRFTDLLLDYYPNVMFECNDLSTSEKMFKDELFLGENDNEQANTNYALRYYAFFAIAQYLNGVTFGTTNRDELGYSGWFGKNSDMMVDVQPISDLHKFQVREYAKLLKVPEAIINRVPTGDLIDGSKDEDNFGCSYDELSYVTKYYQGGYEWTRFMEQRFSKLIALHQKNSHKYQGQGFNPVFL